MEKTIYHGSDHIIEKPKFGYGKPYNDYGIGFYCTQNPNMAKEWGVGIDHNGYANRYEIECDGLTILDLNAPGYTMLHWLTILLENREFDTSAPLAAEAKEYLMNTFHLDYKSAAVSSSKNGSLQKSSTARPYLLVASAQARAQKVYRFSHQAGLFSFLDSRKKWIKAYSARFAHRSTKSRKTSGS